MRTYLTRLIMTAAAAVLTGVSVAGVAHAKDVDDKEAVLDPSVLEALEPCDELSASDLKLHPVKPDELDQDDFPAGPGDLQWPTKPEDPEKGDLELVPCYQVPNDPGDDDGQDPGDDGNDDDGQQPGNNSGGGNAGNTGGGQGNGGSNGPSGGGPSGDPSGDGSDDTADDNTSEPRETVIPTAVTSNDGNSTLMLAALAGVLGALGLFLLTYGLRKRPRRGQQPAR